MAMPERICLAPDQERVLPARITWGAPYIRADLAVLATTHQRTLEALREAVDAAENAVITFGMGWDMDGAIERLNTALARIKEATDDR